jgi:hypothetical protein
MSDFQGIGN